MKFVIKSTFEMKEPTVHYNPIVIEHFKNPRNRGEMENPDGVGEAQNPVCGDTMRIFIRVESDRIIDATFLTFGCSAAIASSSIVTELVKGKHVDEVLKISNQVIDEALGGLPTTKTHATLLAEQAIRGAVENYKKSLLK